MPTLFWRQTRCRKCVLALRPRCTRLWTSGTHNPGTGAFRKCCHTETTTDSKRSDDPGARRHSAYGAGSSSDAILRIGGLVVYPWRHFALKSEDPIMVATTPMMLWQATDSQPSAHRVIRFEFCRIPFAPRLSQGWSPQAARKPLSLVPYRTLSSLS